MIGSHTRSPSQLLSAKLHTQPFEPAAQFPAWMHKLSVHVAPPLHAPLPSHSQPGSPAEHDVLVAQMLFLHSCASALLHAPSAVHGQPGSPTLQFFNMHLALESHSKPRSQAATPLTRHEQPIEPRLQFGRVEPVVTSAGTIALESACGSI